MKKTHIIFIVSLFLLGSCKTNTKEDTIANTTTTEALANTLDIQISTAEGSIIGGFNLSPVKIVFNGAKYTYKSKPDKHKFYVNGEMKYEVKFKETSLKLRDKNSNLLWKVKIYPDKIKVSNNEGNANAFVIKPYENKIKVKQNEEELYKVQFNENTIIVNEKATYTLSSKQENYAYAIMAIEEIPNEHKLFLLAELLNKM